MKINKQNYVDEAERAIQGLIRTDKSGKKKLDLTTSKIRNILSMVSELYTDAQHQPRRKAERRYGQPGTVLENAYCI